VQVPKVGTQDKNLLMVARIFAIPMTGLACMTATLAYNPGYLLVVAFDVVLAGCLVPLLAAVYWPSMTPNAGKQTMGFGGRDLHDDALLQAGVAI
jgi:hypothetical protein